MSAMFVFLVDETYDESWQYNQVLFDTYIRS